MQREFHQNRLHHTISLKPSYDFTTNYLDFHINRQRTPSAHKHPLTHRPSPNRLPSHTNPNSNSNSINMATKQRSVGSSAKQNHQTIHLVDTDEQIKGIVTRYGQIKDGSNQMMKSIVQEELLTYVVTSHPLFRKLNKYLVESLLLLGTLRTFDQDEQITHWQGHLCFMLYGSAKLYNQDIKLVISKGQVLGQHQLFECQPQLKVKSLEQSCLMMLPLKNYHIIRQESIKNGLKDQFSALEIAIRLNFIAKRLADPRVKFAV